MGKSTINGHSIAMLNYQRVVGILTEIDSTTISPATWGAWHSDALLEFSEGKTNWWSSAVPKHIPATRTHSQTSKIYKHITFGWRRCFLYHDTWPNTTSQIPNPIQRLLGLSYNFPPKSSCTTVHLAGVPWAAPLTLPKLQVLGL